MEYLDPLQIDALQQFITITSWPENDIEGAIQMLTVCQWNLELALTRYFDEGPLRPNPHGPPPRPPTPPPIIAPRLPTPTPRTIAPRPSLLTSAITSIIFFPLSVISKLAHTAYYIFAMLFPFLPRLTGLYPANLGAARSQRRSINPRDTAARFIRDFEEEVGQSDVLPFFEGGYTQALDKAKRELRFLIVLLQSDEHDDTTKFNKEVLASPDVVKFIREHDIILWGGNVRESEAYQVANALSCTRYPFLGVIAHTPASTSHPSAMSIHARLQGYLPPESLLANLNTAISRHEPTLARIRAERSEQEAARAIRAAQDSAYEASLAADRERERLREEQEKIERERAEEKERIELEKKDFEARKVAYKKWRAAQLKSQMVDFVGAAPPGAKIARISIRLTSGDRIVTRFLADIQTVEDVYGFVECYELLHPPAESLTAQLPVGSTTEAEDATAEKPENYAHTYKFNLVSPMPRVVLPVDKSRLICDEKTLWPNGNLIVEEVEESDNDGEVEH
ncbi:hypothetical protein V1525DRAFT_400063 [Lipomyces kononenkoae]|uniref:Uncharacterized protein n=1 Tax=Lipomyces kononenkoae TaxID=34357 RepID=A0ACC3T586_LIPKO